MNVKILIDLIVSLPVIPSAYMVVAATSMHYLFLEINLNFPEFGPKR